jgi:1,4-alpha-glucan branching enzyme
MGNLWYELTNRRKEEKTISYAESHDQAIVGDQTLMFRMAGDAMYEHMRVGDSDLRVDRAMALHKMIRLITLATAGNGYLNFMGNEFGHPEWIDFPREGNGWSMKYARRQWHLVDDLRLKYGLLAEFDRRMISFFNDKELLGGAYPELLWEHDSDKVLAFLRAGHIFVFNFHPTASFTGYGIPAPKDRFFMLMDTDATEFGGHGRLEPDQTHQTVPEKSNPWGRQLHLYLPSRTGLVLGPDNRQLSS